MKNIHKINNNIYITSDLKIKEKDWYLFPLFKGGCEIKQYNSEKHFAQEPCISLANLKAKKIILTTDQSLEGVQPIDDEFLEWFVKNPTCEFVPIITTIVSNSPTYKTNIGFESWRKEEIIPVQALSEPDGTGILSAMDVVEPFKEERIIIPQEEPKQYLTEEWKELEGANLCEPLKSWEEPKQEKEEEYFKHLEKDKKELKN